MTEQLQTVNARFAFVPDGTINLNPKSSMVQMNTRRGLFWYVSQVRWRIYTKENGGNVFVAAATWCASRMRLWKLDVCHSFLWPKADLDAGMIGNFKHVLMLGDIVSLYKLFLLKKINETIYKQTILN